MRKNLLYIAFTVSLVATVGSLVLSEILGWAPCALCWYQRTMIYPLVFIFAAAIIKDISNVEYIVLPMLFVGGGIAFYHTLLQYKIIPENLLPCSAGVSCVTNYNLVFDFLSVPLLSLLTFAVLVLLMLAYRKAKI